MQASHLSMNTQNRRQDLDIARGIAIICIVLGHLGSAEINRFVFTFHVTIFYLLSGYLLKEKDSLKVYLRKRSRSLLAPYVVTCCVIIVLAVLLNSCVGSPKPVRDVLLRWVGASLYGAGDNYSEPFVIHGIGAIWFLWSIFWAGLFMQIILKRPVSIRLVLVGVLFLFSNLSRKWFWFPLSIQAGGTAVLFLYLGYLGKEIVPAFHGLRKEIRAALMTGAFWIWIAFIRDFRSFWLVHCDCGRGVIDIAGSICACCCVIKISGLIGKTGGAAAKGLAYLGRFSLLVLCMHMIELDIFPWYKLEEALFGELTGTWHLIFLIIVKFLWIIPMTIVCEKWRVTRRLFGYS